MTIGISAIGTANPNNCYQQTDVAHFMNDVLQLNERDARRLKAVYKKSGIKKRYSVIKNYQFDFPSTKQRMMIYKENALNLALAAIQDCVNVNEFQNITHVITISCTGMYAPGLDIEIIQALNLNTETKRLAIHFMGCYASFNGLKAAYDICKASENAKVLIVSVELCSLHIQKSSNLDDIVSGAIFSDGAAAVIIENLHNIQKNNNQIFLNFEQFYCDLIPEGQKDMAWGIADYGFDIVLTSYVSDLIEQGISQFIDKAKNKLVNPYDIDYYAIHPGGIKILKACEKALNIAINENLHSYEVLENFGNMSSATILFVLKKYWQKLSAVDKNKIIFACAFGPGLTFESVFLKVV